MSEAREGITGTVWLGTVAVLFGVLLFASHGNELLKQIVITPGSTAELGVAANCRADELEEEGLSLQECQLMVSSVQIVLASSPEWFRSFQIALSTLGGLGTIFSIVIGIKLVNRRTDVRRLALICFASLLIIDVIGFFAALNTGPLLRAQYLWPLLIWFFIHLCLLLAIQANANPIDQQAD